MKFTNLILGQQFIPFNSLLSLNLQEFATDPGTPPAGGEGGEGGAVGGDPQDPPNNDPITLTPEELQKRIESETDKKLAKALETSRKKWEAEFAQKLEHEKKEAERLAKLSAKEREEEELKKQREELDKRLKELESKELKADAIAILNEQSLPSSFVEFLVQENAEKTLANINAFKAAFNEAVEAAVEDKLKGTPPSTTSRSSSGGTTTTQRTLRDKAREKRIVGK